MKTIKSTFLLVLAFISSYAFSSYAISATTPYEIIQSFVEKVKSGDSEAQFELGMLYADGQGVKQSYTEAFKWFRKSADQGNINALHVIGLAYKNGIGVQQSYSEAKECFGLACDKGNDLSCDWYAKLNKNEY